VIVLPNAIEVPNAIELPEAALAEKETELTALKAALDEKDRELMALKTALDKNNRELEELRAQLRDLRRDPPLGLLTPKEEDIVTQVRDMLAAIRDGNADGGADKRQEVQELLLRHNSCGSRNVSVLQDALPGRTPTAVRTVRRYSTCSTCHITTVPSKRISASCARSGGSRLTRVRHAHACAGLRRLPPHSA
jgi:hypothetical protein